MTHNLRQFTILSERITFLLSVIFEYIYIPMYVSWVRVGTDNVRIIKQMQHPVKEAHREGENGEGRNWN